MSISCLNLENNIKLVIKDNANDLAFAAARIFTGTATDCVSRKGWFAVALSGGSTPRLMHSLLTGEPFLSEIPWEHTHIFWTDERCVPEDHPYSNFGTAKKDFVDKVRIPESHVYPMSTELSSEKGADKYQRMISAFFELAPGELPRFDLVYLGIGIDGHTASLFPGHWALEEKKRLVVSLKGGDPDVYRLTMTLPVLNNAVRIVILVSGRQKAHTLKTVLEDHDTLLPVQRVNPQVGSLTWLVDREAALMLSKA